MLLPQVKGNKVQTISLFCLFTSVAENTVKLLNNPCVCVCMCDRIFLSPHRRKLNSENFTGISIDSVNNLDSTDYPQAAMENTKAFPRTQEKEY